MPPFVWETAVYDCALLFGDFGKLIDEYRWQPEDLFGQAGLVWFIAGHPVVAIGKAMAQTQDGRVWFRSRGTK
jgi:hypothetical protein